jgi:predicted alpha/beta superfamily hydrolase
LNQLNATGNKQILKTGEISETFMITDLNMNRSSVVVFMTDAVRVFNLKNRVLVTSCEKKKYLKKVNKGRSAVAPEVNSNRSLRRRSSL